MKKGYIFIIVFLSIVLISACNKTESDKTSDSIIEKIDLGTLDKLTIKEQAYFDNVFIKANAGQELTPNENKVYENTAELNPARFLSDICVMKLPFTCENFLVTKTQITLTIFNPLNDDLTDVIVSVPSCEKDATLDYFESGEGETFVLEDCNNIESEDTGKVSQAISLEYADDDGVKAITEGVLSSKIN